MVAELSVTEEGAHWAIPRFTSTWTNPVQDHVATVAFASNKLPIIITRLSTLSVARIQHDLSLHAEYNFVFKCNKEGKGTGD